MNRNMKIIIGIFALLAGAIAVGVLYYQLNPGAWDQFKAEMAGETAPQTETRPVARRTARRAGVLMASGNVEAEEVTVAAELGGRVVGAAVGEGDEVAAGDLLLQLDQQSLLAQREGALATVAQALAALDATEAELAKARVGATQEEITAARAAVLAAEGAVAAAKASQTQAEISASSARTVKQTESSVAMAEAALAEAEGAVDAAEADLARANAELTRLKAGARPEEIAMYQALVNQAQSEFLYFENIHFDYYIAKDIGGGPEERARYQRESARGARDAAQARLDLAAAGATAEEIAAAEATVAAARAQVTMAKAGRDSAEAALVEAQAAPETTQDNVALADAGVSAAQAQVKVAEGQLAQAQAALDRLLAGATEEEIAMLQAQVTSAEAALAAAESALKAIDIELDRATLLAPTGGVIVERLVHEGELAAPGAALFTLADLDEVTLTVYVPEAELDKVVLGQEVEVTVDAYDQTFTGQVVHIASEAEFTPKNVQTQEERVHMVFGVKIRLDNPEHLLKPGMPADAVFR